jgi:uncharacterized protein DUF6585
MSNQVPTENYQLGALITKYERNDDWLYLGPLVILFAAVPAVVFLVVLVYFPPGGKGIADGIGDASPVDLLCWLAASCLCLWWIPYGVWQTMKTQGIGKVLVFNDGLVYIDGDQSEVWRWDGIAHVWHAVKVEAGEGEAITRNYYTIQRADGLKRTFDEYLSNHDILGETIQQEVAKRGGKVWPIRQHSRL